MSSKKNTPIKKTEPGKGHAKSNRSRRTSVGGSSNSSKAAPNKTSNTNVSKQPIVTDETVSDQKGKVYITPLSPSCRAVWMYILQVTFLHNVYSLCLNVTNKPPPPSTLQKI